MRFEVVHELGEGAFSVVEAVRDTLRGDRLVARKRLKNPEHRDAFLAEFRRLNRLSHPGFPQVHELESDDEEGRLAFTMELCEGVDWVAWSAGCEEQDLRRGIVELVRIIAALHVRGEVHGDLHPDNMRISNPASGLRVKVLDVGGVPQSGDGTVQGALPWLAPERLKGADAHPGSDWFSVGVLVHQALTGEHPFSGYPRKKATPWRPPAKATGLLRGLGRWLKGLLELDPEARTASREEVLSGLAQGLGEEVSSLTLEEVEGRSGRVEWVHVGKHWAALSGKTQDVHSMPAVAEKVMSLSDPVQLVGGPGSGRTRALRELRTCLQYTGVRVAESSASPGDVALSLIDRLILDLLGVSATAPPPEVVQELPEAIRTVLATRFEGWSVDASFDESPEEDPEVRRNMRLDVVAQALRAFAGDRPVAIVLDRMDLADEESRHVLQTLARERAAGDSQINIVATSDEGVELFDRSARVTLAPWGTSAVAQFMKTMSGGHVPDKELVDRVRRSTGGNPAVVEASFIELVSRGWITVVGEGMGLAPETPDVLGLLGTMEELLNARVEALDATSLEVMHRMVLLDVPVGLPALQSLLADLLEDVAGSLDALVAAGLLRMESSGRRVVWTVANPATGERVGNPLEGNPAQHARVLEALAREGDGGPGVEMARMIHRLQSVETPSDESLAEAIALAERRAEESAPGDSLRILDAMGPTGEGGSGGSRRALVVRGEVLGVLGRFDEANVAFQFALHQGGEPGERIAVLLRQARLHADQGVTAAALESLQIAEGILGELDDTSIHGAEIASLKASAHRISGDYAASRAACQNGLEQLMDDTQGADGVHASLSREMGFAAFYQGESLEALQWFEASRFSEAARGARLGVLTANISIATVHHRQGKLKEAFDAYRAALETARELGDRAREAALRMNLGVIHQERSEHGAAITEYEAAGHLSEALGDRGGVLRVRNNLGNLLLHLGDFQEARIQITRSLTLSRMEGNQYIEAYNLTLLGELARVEKQQAEALERLGEARALFDAQGCRHEVMEVDLERAQTLADGVEFKAAAEIAQLVRDAANKVDSSLVEVKACTLLAETERSAPDGDLESASAAISSALEMLDAVDGLEVRWPVHVTAARVARDRGDLEQARGHAADALEGLRALVRDLPPALQAQYRQAHGRREAEEEMRWVEALAGSPGAASAAPPSRGGQGNFGKLLEINKRLNMVHDLARLLEYIMDSAVLLTGAERGFLLLPSEKADVLDVRVARNIDQENIGEGRFKISTSIAERVLAAGEPVLTIDAMEDERYREMLSVHAQRLRSVLCVPMRRAGRTIGAIYIDNRFQVEAFGDEDVAFMEAFADQAGIALGNASLFEENRLAREELEISEKEIAKLNKKLEERLALTSQQLEESQTRVQRQQRQLSNRHQYANIVGNSAGLQEVLFVVDRVRDNDVPVLVTGESGTGKELVARAIHYNGRRKPHEFVAVNCGSIPENLFESELFGHVRGAFTGANADKKGLFEVAHRGTLFLDELGELPLEMQVKLLRVLQQGELKRVGGNRTVKVDVRVVGATNRNVLDMVESGLFREDLYYRLNVVSVRVPPLRERPDDVPALVQHFLTLNKESGLTEIDRIDAPALALLSRHPWRGNIRELDTVLKNASLFADGDELTVEDFQPLLGMDGIGRASMGSATESGVDFHVGVPLAELEREAIIRTLEAQGGNKKRTAEILGIDRRTLYNKLASYGVQIEKRARVRIPK